MAQNTKGLKGQGRMSRSSVKVTDLLNQTCVCYCWISTRNLKMMAIARFCCSVLPLPRWKQKNKKNTETGSITILTESTSQSIIIMRFVPTNYLLYKMKKVSSHTCTFCNLEPETIEHLFFQCIHVKDIWWYVFEEWAKLTGNTYEPNLRGCVLGVYNNNVDDTRAINTIVLIVKAYIMKCKYEQSDCHV